MRISAYRSVLALVAAGVTCLLPHARASERLTLSNGSDLLCNHHAVFESRVRVYLTADEANYFELEAGRITGVETVPDLPAQAAAEDKLGNTPEAAQPPALSKRAESRLTADELHQLLSAAGSQHHVDEDLLASVVKAESGGNAHAVSRAGARGLMQLMPGTARELGVCDSFAPDENVRGGTAYLDALLTRYRDNIALALAAYNAGPEAVDRYRGIPPFHETRAYVARVVHEFNRRVVARSRLSGQVESK